MYFYIDELYFYIYDNKKIIMEQQLWPSTKKSYLLQSQKY